MFYSYSSSNTMENRWQDVLNSRFHIPLTQRNFCKPGITPSVLWAGLPYPPLPLFSCVLISLNSKVLHGDDYYSPLGHQIQYLSLTLLLFPFCNVKLVRMAQRKKEMSGTAIGASQLLLKVELSRDLLRNLPGLPTSPHHAQPAPRGASREKVDSSRSHHTVTQTARWRFCVLL